MPNMDGTPDDTPSHTPESNNAACIIITYALFFSLKLRVLLDQQTCSDDQLPQITDFFFAHDSCAAQKESHSPGSWREGKSVLQHFQHNRTLSRKGWETRLCSACRNRLFWPFPCCWHQMTCFPHFPVACYMTLKSWLFTCLLIRSRSHKMTFMISSSWRLHQEGIKYSTNLSPKLILQCKFVTR